MVERVVVGDGESRVTTVQFDVVVDALVGRRDGHILSTPPADTRAEKPGGPVVSDVEKLLTDIRAQL